MKAWFIFKDGKIDGDPRGYSTKESAARFLSPRCDDYIRLLGEYQDRYQKYNGSDSIPDDLKRLGIFQYDYMAGKWFIRWDLWQPNIWKPYVKEHYKIEEKEYKIVFDD